MTPGVASPSVRHPVSSHAVSLEVCRPNRYSHWHSEQPPLGDACYFRMRTFMLRNKTHVLCAGLLVLILALAVACGSNNSPTTPSPSPAPTPAPTPTPTPPPAPAALATFTISPSRVQSQQGAVGTVTLTTAAPSGGITVDL